jgi:hypothetical protein
MKKNKIFIIYIEMYHTRKHGGRSRRITRKSVGSRRPRGSRRSRVGTRKSGGRRSRGGRRGGRSD